MRLTSKSHIQSRASFSRSSRGTRSSIDPMGKMRSLLSRSGSGRRSSSTKSSPPPSVHGGSSSSPARTPTSSAAALRPEDEMERIFRKFDANGDGQISRTELAALFESVGHAATDDEVTRMMEEADADGDGYISLAEFAAINATAPGDAAVVEEDLRHAFGVFDADSDGAISPAELARVLRGLGEAATVAQCRRMIDGVDRNGDGLVSFDEFKIMMAAGGGFGNVRA